jgi:hypothetical protein
MEKRHQRLADIPVPDRTFQVSETFDESGHVTLGPTDSRKMARLERMKNIYRNLLLGVLSFNALVAAVFVYEADDLIFSRLQPPVESVVPVFTTPPAPEQYPADLLNAMGARLEELGFPRLTHEQLAGLRDNGVTATFVGQLKAAGFSVSLNDAIRLARHGVSAEFVSMMKALGYSLSLDELIKLKDAGVTANWVSQMTDAGYQLKTVDEMIRLRSIGAGPENVRNFIVTNGRKPSTEELIRYRISNQ